MKYLKYVLVIIVIGLLVFVGVEFLRGSDGDNPNHNVTNTTENGMNNTNEANNTIVNNTENVDNSNEIENGEQLLEKADKTLTARGWAGASSNVIGLKNNTLYFYNKETGEFKKIATGIEDIYYNESNREEIIAKKGENAEILDEGQTFLVYE